MRWFPVLLDGQGSRVAALREGSDQRGSGPGYDVAGWGWCDGVAAIVPARSTARTGRSSRQSALRAEADLSELGSGEPVVAAVRKVTERIGRVRQQRFVVQRVERAGRQQLRGHVVRDARRPGHTMC